MDVALSLEGGPRDCILSLLRWFESELRFIGSDQVNPELRLEVEPPAWILGWNLNGENTFFVLKIY